MRTSKAQWVVSDGEHTNTYAFDLVISSVEKGDK